MHGIAFFTGFVAVLAAGALALAAIGDHVYATYHAGCSVPLVSAAQLWIDLSATPTGITVDSITVAGLTLPDPGSLLSFETNDIVRIALFAGAVITGGLGVCQCLVAMCGGRTGLIILAVLQFGCIVVGAGYLGYRVESLKSQIDDLTFDLPTIGQKAFNDVCGSPVKSVGLGLTMYLVIGAAAAALLNLALAFFVGRNDGQQQQVVVVQAGAPGFAEHSAADTELTGPQSAYTKIQVQ